MVGDKDDADNGSKENVARANLLTVLRNDKKNVIYNGVRKLQKNALL